MLHAPASLSTLPHVAGLSTETSCFASEHKRAQLNHAKAAEVHVIQPTMTFMLGVKAQCSPHPVIHLSHKQVRSQRPPVTDLLLNRYALKQVKHFERTRMKYTDNPHQTNAETARTTSKRIPTEFRATASPATSGRHDVQLQKEAIMHHLNTQFLKKKQKFHSHTKCTDVSFINFHTTAPLARPKSKSQRYAT